jgi:hypothetical protein
MVYPEHWACSQGGFVMDFSDIEDHVREADADEDSLQMRATSTLRQAQAELLHLNELGMKEDE